MIKTDKPTRKKSIASLEETFLAAIEGRVIERHPDAQEYPPSDVSALRQDKGRVSEQTDEWLGIELEISEDAMEVVLRAHNAGPLTVAQIRQKLEKKGVIHGIDEAAIAQAEKLLTEKGGWQGNLVIARGTPPGQSFNVSYPFLKKIEGKTPGETVWLVDGLPFMSFNLKKALKSADPKSIDQLANTLLKVMKPGEPVIIVSGATEAKPGKDVRGIIKTETKIPFVLGDNIKFNDRHGHYEAAIYGYFHADGDELSIVPPLWIAPDKMACYFVNLPQLGMPVYPTPEDIRSMLVSLQIKQEYHKTATIEKLCEKIAQREQIPLTVKIARGTPPKPGVNARIEYCFDSGLKAGEIRKDDSIDLRERSAVKSAKKGDILAKKILPIRGVPGATIFGDVINTSEGKDIELRTDRGINKEEKDGTIFYIAKTDGNILFKNKVLSVIEVYQVEGDVDYSTGNINVGTDLVIKGSVGSGFTVKAYGNIKIGGAIETGAMVIARGNLTVDKGIIGSATKVVVMGDVRTSFIQDAEVIAKGNVIIGSYLYNGTVRAAGSITVLKELGSKKGGMVVGGIICATKGIEMCTVGSPTNKNTVVALQADPALVGELNEIKTTVQEYSEKIVKIMRTLQMDTFDPVTIKEKLDKIPEDKREAFSNILLNLNKLIKSKISLEEKADRLTEKMDKSLEQATIRVSEEFFEGNEIQIGTKKYVAPKDLGPTVFQLQNDTIIL